MDRCRHRRPRPHPQPRPLGPIQETPDYWKKLDGLVLSEEELRLNGYRLKGFSSGELWRLRRCQFCRHRVQKKPAPKKTDDQKDEGKDRKQGERTPRPEQAVSGAKTYEQTDTLPNAGPPCNEVEQSPTKLVITINADTGETAMRTEALPVAESETGTNASPDVKDGHPTQNPKKKPVCRSHPGPLVVGRFACCQKSLFEPGCVEREGHTVRDTCTLEQLEADWRLHETPVYVRHARRAVALDCEMGITQTGDVELVRVSALDYFTGEALLDSLVWPAVPMLHLNSRYSGVTWAMLHHARATRTCLAGRDQAREHLWQLVGPDTVVVAHGGAADLLALRWIHRRVVDTFQVEGRREQPEPGRSLKNLAAVLLHRSIQQDRRGHDSVEDTRACRELAHWYVEHVAGDQGVDSPWK